VGGCVGGAEGVGLCSTRRVLVVNLCHVGGLASKQVSRDSEQGESSRAVKALDEDDRAVSCEGQHVVLP
jgi:hypothetical protein